MTEHSIVDPVSKTMVLKSRNVTCSNLMIVEETCTYRPHPENPNWTSYKIEAKISAFAPFLSHRLEQHSLSNISSQAQKGLRVMESLCDMVSQETFDALTYLRNLSQGVQRSRS